MNGHSSKLRFGASYCPYAKSGDVDISVWERDFKTMKKLNFNAIRCFVAWDRIESEEGKFDFAKVDYIFELAAKYNIDVILNVGGVFATYGGIYPPRWLIYDYHCQEVIENPRLSEVGFGPYRMLCPDDEIYQAKATSFTAMMIRRYANNPVLFAWNVWNEAYLNPQCYCPVTLTKFREWLKRKYQGNLDALNKIWGTEFPVLFRNWESIEPGLGSGFLAGGCVARLDWLNFNQDRVASWINQVNDLVHEHDVLARPTTSNIVTTAAFGDASWHGIPDIWSQSRNLDITGFSFYTTFANVSNISAGLSSVRGSSNDPDKGFWVLETESGQVYDASLASADVVDGPRREATHWLSVLHGAKTILVWKFGGRVTDSQTDSYNLTAWDGAITERAGVNAKVAEIFLANESLFLNRSYNSDVAILHSADNALFSHATGAFKDWHSARMGAFRILRDLHIQADSISDVQIREGNILAKYKYLFLPCILSMDKALADAIAEFITKGGTVIADQRLAVFDANGVNQLQVPGHGLKEVFGALINDYILGPETMTIKLSDNHTLNVNGNCRSIIHCQDKTCEIIGCWPDKTAAIIAKKTGKGNVLWFGFQAFRDYELKPNADFLDFMRHELLKLGIKSDYDLFGLNPSDDVEIGALTGNDGKRTHFLINLSSRDITFELGINNETNILRDLLSKDSLDFSMGRCKISLPAWGTKIMTDNQNDQQIPKAQMLC